MRAQKPSTLRTSVNKQSSTVESDEGKSPGVISAAQLVVDFASPIQRIMHVDSPSSHTFELAGYFIPTEKIDDLRLALNALRKVANDIRSKNVIE